MNATRSHGERGMALLLALFFTSIALVLLSGIALRLVNQRNQVGHFDTYKQCFNGLDTAYVKSKAGLESGEDGAVGMGGITPELLDIPATAQAALDDIETREMLYGSSNVSYAGFAQNWETDSIDNTGNGMVDDSSERFMYTIHAFAQSGTYFRRAEAVIRGFDVNVWRNAIFAGAGQAGGLVNGNVSIHGSVHLLGENLLEGNQAIAALDMSGASLIHNNYNGLDPGLAARIPALTTTDWNGEEVETLDAVLRVKNGLVALSGNSEIGSPDVPGNDYKETMDATYVEDGWTGNSVLDDGDRGDPTCVESDNGWDEGYDLGDRVEFPLLSDPWRDPDNGHKVWNSDMDDWYTHDTYFSEVLVAQPDNPTDGIFTGNVTLDAANKGGNPKYFYWNATTGEHLEDSLPESMPPSDHDYLWFDSEADMLYVNGQVRINGDLELTGQANDMVINYTGRGAVLVDGDVTLDTDLLACNNGDPSNTAISFPVNNCFGIMATEDMIVGSASQLTLMGAFYAQGKITSAKQTTVLGTFVSNYFDMGTNVPDIYQVPTLADNLPHGMIGNFPILAFVQESWREIGVEL